MKKCFIPSPGYTLIEADYSQLEIRLAVAYANVPSLQDVFNNDRDVFSEMAAELGMARQDTKTLVYSLQYGAGLPRIMHVFGVSESRANQIREGYFSKYPGFKRIADEAKDLARRYRNVPFWTGRFRHFTSEDNPGKGLNAMIQGGSADIMERTMLRVESGLVDGSDCRMILQVHDSIVLEVRDHLVPQVKQEIKHLMEAVDPDFGVKFAVDVKDWAK
jgi:DNA polymerase-1